MRVDSMAAKNVTAAPSVDVDVAADTSKSSCSNRKNYLGESPELKRQVKRGEISALWPISPSIDFG